LLTQVGVAAALGIQKSTALVGRIDLESSEEQLVSPWVPVNHSNATLGCRSKIAKGRLNSRPTLPSQICILRSNRVGEKACLYSMRKIGRLCMEPTPFRRGSAASRTIRRRRGLFCPIPSSSSCPCRPDTELAPKSARKCTPRWTRRPGRQRQMETGRLCTWTTQARRALL